MRRVRRPEEIPESDPTVGFSDSLSFFFFHRRERGCERARLSPIQSMASGAENNDAMRRDVKFFRHSSIIWESRVDSISDRRKLLL